MPWTIVVGLVVLHLLLVTVAIRVLRSSARLDGGRLPGPFPAALLAGTRRPQAR